jgi:hypothetical protein
MKGSNGWKISWHFLSVGESSFHRFWASPSAMNNSSENPWERRHLACSVTAFFRWMYSGRSSLLLAGATSL